MKISKSTLFLYIATASFVLGSSAYIKINSAVGLSIDAFQACILAYCFLNLYMQKRVGTYFWLVVLFYLFIGVSTLIGTKQYATYIVYAVQASSATIFIKYGIENYPLEIFEVLRNVLITVIILNFVLVLAFPEGFTVVSNVNYHLLGNRIAFTPFLMAAIFFSFVQDYVENQGHVSVYTYGTIIICYITALFESVATGIVAISVVLLVFLLLNSEKIRISLSVFYIVYAVVFVAIVVFNIQYNIPFFSYFLVDVLNKDLTFDNRTTIWLATIEAFMKKPILGYGLTGGGSIQVQFTYISKTLTAHNQILNTLYEGGVLAFSVFVALCGYISNAVKKYKTDILAKICTAFVIGFFFIMFTEVQMEKAIIFLLFATAANVPAIMDVLNELQCQEENDIM